MNITAGHRQRHRRAPAGGALDAARIVAARHAALELPGDVLLLRQRAHPVKQRGLTIWDLSIKLMDGPFVASRSPRAPLRRWYVGGSALQRQRAVRLHAEGRRLCAAQTDFL